MARTITVGTKVEKKTHEHLAKVAAAQNKSVSEVVRDLILDGLERGAQGVENAAPGELSGRLDELQDLIAFHHNALGELLLKAVKISTGARYFSELAVSYGQDITSCLMTGKPMETQTKQSEMGHFENKSRQMAQEFLMKPLDELPI